MHSSAVWRYAQDVENPGSSTRILNAVPPGMSSALAFASPLTELSGTDQEVHLHLRMCSLLKHCARIRTACLHALKFTRAHNSKPIVQLHCRAAPLLAMA